MIAAIIIAALTLVYNYITSKSQNINFKDAFLNFWEYKIEIWIYVLFSVIVFTLIILYKDYKNRSKPLHSKDLNSGTLLFESDKAKNHFFIASGEQTWENDKPISEVGKGSFTFKDQIIDIDRSNKDGRFLIKIVKYYLSDSPTDFIKRDIYKQGVRIINIKF